MDISTDKAVMHMKELIAILQSRKLSKDDSIVILLSAMLHFCAQQRMSQENVLELVTSCLERYDDVCILAWAERFSKN